MTSRQDKVDHYGIIKDFLNRKGEWIRQEIPNCGYGIAAADKPGGRLRIALRPQKITPEVQEKIDILRQEAAELGYELDVRETGPIVAY